MPVSRTYHDYVIDQMRKISAVTSRAMFGGYAVYSNGLAFAILDDDHLYFKTNDSNRADYVLEDPSELAAWAQKAIAMKGDGRESANVEDRRSESSSRGKFNLPFGNFRGMSIVALIAAVGAAEPKCSMRARRAARRP